MCALKKHWCWIVSVKSVGLFSFVFFLDDITSSVLVVAFVMDLFFCGCGYVRFFSFLIVFFVFFVLLVVVIFTVLECGCLCCLVCCLLGVGVCFCCVMLD